MWSEGGVKRLVGVFCRLFWPPVASRIPREARAVQDPRKQLRPVALCRWLRFSAELTPGIALAGARRRRLPAWFRDLYTGPRGVAQRASREARLPHGRAAGRFGRCDGRADGRSTGRSSGPPSGRSDPSGSVGHRPSLAQNTGPEIGQFRPTLVYGTCQIVPDVDRCLARTRTMSGRTRRRRLPGYGQVSPDCDSEFGQIWANLGGGTIIVLERLLIEQLRVRI